MIIINKNQKEKFKKVNIEIEEKNLQKFNEIKKENQLTRKFLFNYLIKKRMKEEKNERN